MTVFVRRLAAAERRWWQRRRTPYDVAWVDGARVVVRRTPRLTSDLMGWLRMHSTDAHDHRTAADVAAGEWTTPFPPGATDDWVRAAASTLADLVRPAADDWAATLDRLANAPETGADLARRALGLHGGAGSLTDLVLWQDGQVTADMELVDTLRSLLHHLAVQLR